MKRHPLDPVSLVFGGLLAGLGGFLASADARWESVGGAWVLPALLVVMGGAILWSTLFRLRGTALSDETTPAEVEPDEVEPDEWAIPDIPEADFGD